MQGAVLDQMGRHADAQRYYASALRPKPDEPSVLSNLGLSYALAKKPAAGRVDAAPRRRAGLSRAQSAPEPGAGGGPAGPLPGGRADREQGPVAGRGPGQRRLSAPDGLAEQQQWKKNQRASPLTPSTGS